MLICEEKNLKISLLIYVTDFIHVYQNYKINGKILQSLKIC